MACHLLALPLPLNTQPITNLMLVAPTPSLKRSVSVSVSMNLRSFRSFRFPFLSIPCSASWTPCSCFIPSFRLFPSVPLCSRCLCLPFCSSSFLLLLPSVDVLSCVSPCLLLSCSFPFRSFVCLGCLFRFLLSCPSLSVRPSVCLSKSCQQSCHRACSVCVLVVMVLWRFRMLFLVVVAPAVAEPNIDRFVLQLPRPVAQANVHSSICVPIHVVSRCLCPGARGLGG